MNKTFFFNVPSRCVVYSLTCMIKCSCFGVHHCLWVWELVSHLYFLLFPCSKAGYPNQKVSFYPLGIFLVSLPIYFFSVSAFQIFGGGLAVGLSGLAAGVAIGVVGDTGVRGMGQQPRLFVGMILILVFAEVLGIYGLIVALILVTQQ